MLARLAVVYMLIGPDDELRANEKVLKEVFWAYTMKTFEDVRGS